MHVTTRRCSLCWLPVVSHYQGKFAPKFMFSQSERQWNFGCLLNTLTKSKTRPTPSVLLLYRKLKMAPNSPMKRLHVEESAENRKQEPIVLRYTKCRENAQAPKRGSEKSAGFDLYSASEVVIPKHGKGMVQTGLKIALPDNCYGRIAPRSGLAKNHFIDVGAGVIDQDYRGEIGVILFNFSDIDFTVTKGQRIAQLICEKIYMPELQECKELDETARGSGGYGSSGMN